MGHPGHELKSSVPDVQLGETERGPSSGKHRCLAVGSFLHACAPTEGLPTPCCYLLKQRHFKRTLNKILETETLLSFPKAV